MAAAPLDIQPYQPTALPDPIKPPKESPFQGQPNTPPGLPTTKVGAIAGIADSILRGYVNGKAMGEAHRALTLKKKSDDLSASYNADAQRLYQIAQSQLQSTGKVDPTSPDYQAAQSAVSGSWGALQDFRGGLLGQAGGKPKTKGQKKDQTRPPAQVLTDPSSSPQEKAQALHDLSSKIGPPVVGQIQTLQAQFSSPQAQQQRKTQELQSGNEMTQQQAMATHARYAGWTDDEVAKLPPEEQKAKRNADAIVAGSVKETGTTREYVSPDGKQSSWYVPGREPEGWNAYNKPTAASKPYRAWTKDASGKFTSVLLDPQTNQQIPGSENGDIAPPASLSGRITIGDYHWVDANGDLHATKETRTSTPLAQSSGAIPPASHPAPSSAAQTATSQVPVNPPTVITQSLHGKPVPGLLEKGNVDIANRPNIDNGDGTHSSVYSMSFDVDGKEVLVPGVGDGKTYPARKLTKDEALDQYKKTGQNLGTFKDEKSANAYADALHKDQAKYGSAPKSAGAPSRRVEKTHVVTPSTSVPATQKGTPGDRVIGHKGTPEEVKAKELADVRDTAFRESTARMKHPTPIGDTGIVFDWVRTQVAGAGRMTNTEIEQALKSGNWETKFRNAYDRAVTGKLDAGFRRQMVMDIGESARSARATANAYGKTLAAETDPPKSSQGFDWDKMPLAHQ